MTIKTFLSVNHAELLIKENGKIVYSGSEIPEELHDKEIKELFAVPADRNGRTSAVIIINV